MKSTLITRHRSLLGKDPTFEQLALYEAVPKKRGFASARALTETQEAELFEAVFVLALSQTFVEGTGGTPNNVYLFVPPGLERWTTQQIQRLAGEMFAICKRVKSVALAKHLGVLFRHLMVGSKIASSTQAPDRWAAFGYDPNGPQPKWLTDGLLPVYAFLRDDETDAG